MGNKGTNMSLLTEDPTAATEQKPEVTDVGRALAAEMFSILVHPAPDAATLNQYDSRLVRAGEVASGFVPAASLAAAHKRITESVAVGLQLEHDLLDIAEHTRGDWTSRTESGGRAQMKVSALMDEFAASQERVAELEGEDADSCNNIVALQEQLASERAGREEANRKLILFSYRANSLLGYLSNDPDSPGAKDAWDRLQALVEGEFPEAPPEPGPQEATRDPDPATPLEGPASPVAEGEVGTAEYWHSRFSRCLSMLTLTQEQNSSQAAENRKLRDAVTQLLISGSFCAGTEQWRVAIKQAEGALRSQPTPTGEAKDSSPSPGPVTAGRLPESGDGSGADDGWRAFDRLQRVALGVAADIRTPDEHSAALKWACRKGNSPVAPAAEGERRCPFGCLQTSLGEPCICAGCRPEPPPASPPASDAERCAKVVASYRGNARCVLATGHPGFHSYAPPPRPHLGEKDDPPASDAGGECRSRPEACPTCSKRFLRSGPRGAAAWAEHQSGYDCPDPWHEPNQPPPSGQGPTEALTKALRDAEYELGEMLRQHGVLTSANMDPSHRFFVSLLGCVKELAKEADK